MVKHWVCLFAMQLSRSSATRLPPTTRLFIRPDDGRIQNASATSAFISTDNAEDVHPCQELIRLIQQHSRLFFHTPCYACRGCPCRERLCFAECAQLGGGEPQLADGEDLI